MHFKFTWGTFFSTKISHFTKICDKNGNEWIYVKRNEWDGDMNTAIIAKYGNAYAGSKPVWWRGWKNRNYAGSCALMEMMQCD